MKWIQPLTPEIIEKRRRSWRRLRGAPIRFWRKTRRFFLWSLALGFVLHCALNLYASTLLNRELRAIRQKGEPLQIAEMEPPAVPNSQNAALVYAQATKSSLALTSSDAMRTLATSPEESTPQIERDTEAALRRNQKGIELVRRAAAMPKCLFPLDWKTDSALGPLFPYYSEMRNLARVMAAQAVLEAKNGDREAALRDVRAVFRMAHHLSDEPLLIGFLVAQALDAIANQALAQVLESVPLTREQARVFNASLPGTNWNRSFHRCLLGERAFSISLFQTVNPLGLAKFITAEYSAEGPKPLQPWTYYPVNWLWRPVFKMDQVQSLRLWKSQLDAASNPQLWAFSNSSEIFDKAVEDLPLYAVLTRILMPVFSRVSTNRDKSEVRRRQREIALALTVYRTQKGSYPPQLSQIAPLWKKALPLDPYNRKAFRYVREGKGESFLLYSVGENRTDDGGRGPWTRRNGWKPGEDDLVWRGSLH